MVFFTLWVHSGKCYINVLLRSTGKFFFKLLDKDSDLQKTNFFKNFTQAYRFESDKCKMGSFHYVEVKPSQNLKLIAYVCFQHVAHYVDIFVWIESAINFIIHGYQTKQ